MSKIQFKDIVLPDGSNAKEAQVTAQLLDIADEARENVNGTLYRPCTVKFDNNGTPVTCGAIMYEGNFKQGVTKGGHYLATISKQDGADRPSIRISHLEQSVGLTDDMFDYSSEEVSSEADLSKAE